jgi:hypothetical protein
VKRTLLVGCGWLALLAGFAGWIATTENFELRDQLRRWQFWVLEAQFALLLVLSPANVRACVRALRLTRRDCAMSAAVMGLAACLAGGVAPLTNRIYYDEQIYQGIAQNLSDLRLAQMCNDGTVEYGHLQCWRGEYNKQPNGFPYLVSVVYRLSGVGYWTASRVNVASAALLAGVVFLLAATLFQDVRVGLFAALIAALMPEHLRWSHTAAAEPAATAAGAFAVMAAAHFVRSRTTSALAWTIAATAFAVQFKTESVVLALVVVSVIVVWAPSELRRRRLWEWALAGAVLAAPLVAHLIAVRNEAWGATGVRWSWQFVAANLQTNGRFYLADWRFPALYTALAFVALALWRDRRATLMTFGYFCVFFGLYLAFYAGSYNYGADVRFALMTFPPLAILAGAGAVAVAGGLERVGIRPGQAELLVAGAVAFQFLTYMPWVRAVGEEAWAARADVSFSERVAAKLPRNAIVLTHNPSVFHAMGYSAAQLSLATEPNYVKEVLIPRYRGGVFLHWNFWCNVSDPVQQEFCTSTLERFPHALFAEYRERDYRYAFYRLEADSTAR